MTARPISKTSASPSSNDMGLTVAIAFATMAALAAVIVFSSILLQSPAMANDTSTAPSKPTIAPTPTFDPALNAVLPRNRIVAFYAIPGAEVAGPAFELSQTMLTNLKKQGAAYAAADPTHPVTLGIDLVSNVADGAPGPSGTYSHRIDPADIQRYIDFCQQNNLVLFLDLEFGKSAPQDEFNAALPYLQKYPFVHLAIDPEWAFDKNSNGVPGVYVGSMKAADINWMIGQLAAIPQAYHIPRKILIIHQFRDIVLPDKKNIQTNPLVDLVLHVDSVGNYNGGSNDKIQQYAQWVKGEPIQYGGFKLFYNLESPYHLMTPQEVLSMNPPPLVVTYGN